MKSKKRFIFFFGSIVVLITLIELLYGYLISNTNKKQSYAIEEHLLQFKPTIEKELEKYNLSDKTTTLLGIMYQESRGEGTDPMQSSESLELKRNEIQDVNLSIEQGVKHFDQSPDMYTCGDNKKNFRYPYCFGDFTYTTKVKNKTKLIEDFLRTKEIAYNHNSE
ncbi:lysozyme family protein [Bacillus cereus]|uniref:lysozyme family protein n=1 Tax=Bacillus cereus TaxID=1396 RepID=UPI001E62FA76|nr:lysozyme family protein [Bacillus cereus]